MEKTTKKVTLIKVALSLLSLVVVLAGQIVSQLIGSGLLAAALGTVVYLAALQAQGVLPRRKRQKT